MGADGGIAWTFAYDLEKAVKLLEPWIDSLVSLGGDCYYTSRAEAKIGCFGNLVGGYGTDFGDFPTLLDLEGWINYLDSLLICELRGIGKDATFNDLFVERQTRPYDFNVYATGETPQIKEWLDWLKDNSYYTSKNKKLVEFRSQKISEWRKEIGLALTGQEDGVPYVESEETWT
jgi:hypothetical protein